MTTLQQKSGFTLVELLLYIATASLLLLAISSFAILLSESRIKHRTITEVEQQGQFITELISQAVRNAEAVTSPAVGSSGTSLVLDVVDTANDPTSFSVSSGTLQMARGSGPTTLDLSSSAVTVSGFTVTNLSRNNTSNSVKIEFTVTSVNPTGRNEFDFEQSFTTTATVRYD